jgi:hypothetical protein
MAKTELFEPQCPEDVDDTSAGRRQVKPVAALPGKCFEFSATFRVQRRCPVRAFKDANGVPVSRSIRRNRDESNDQNLWMSSGKGAPSREMIFEGFQF